MTDSRVLLRIRGTDPSPDLTEDLHQYHEIMIVVRLNHPLTHAAAKAFIALAFVFGVQTAQATALSDLLVPGATLHVGDLTFSDFTYQSTGEMPAATSINVALSGSSGLLFQGAFLDIPVSGSTGTFGYQVTADPGWSIVGQGCRATPRLSARVHLR